MSIYHENQKGGLSASSGDVLCGVGCGHEVMVYSDGV